MENPQKPNPYNNEVALKDLLKMMKRRECVTISFAIDRYGYESIEVESKRMDKFHVQHIDGLFDCLYNYLTSGDIDTSNLCVNGEPKVCELKSTNEFATKLLRIFMAEPKQRPHMHIVPEIVDKPDKLTVSFAYQFGIIVFKVKRTKEIMEFLRKQDF